MAITGKNSLTLRKRDLDNEKTIAVGFTKLQAWHKADAGETGIDLLAMNFPPEVVNESNPSNAKLAKAQLRKYARNVTVTSTLSGKLMREISYTIPNATRINWVGFTAAQDEIFEITVDYSASTELTVVDGKPLVVTGTLASGQTDIVVGQPFEAGKFIDQQTGSVQVYIDGVQQFRNTNNQASPADGNYYEVNVGGVSNLIRMNVTSGSDRDYLVMSNGVIAERPIVSQQADIERVQGQVDAMIPDLAQATGNPETNYQAAPNNIDLKTFGDRVIALENNGSSTAGEVRQIHLERRSDLLVSSIAIPFDNTIPQISEGVEAFNFNVTPKKSGNKFLIEVNLTITEGSSLATGCVSALFIDGASDAVATYASGVHAGVGVEGVYTIITDITIGAAPVNISVRYGPVTTGSMYLNQARAAASVQGLGGTMVSSVKVTEIEV